MKNTEKKPNSVRLKIIEKNYYLKYKQAPQDKRLSLNARAIFDYMLSVGENWRFSIKGLAKQNGTSEKTIRRALNELKEYEYITIEKYKPTETKSGKYEYIYYLNELPHQTIINNDLINDKIINELLKIDAIEKSPKLKKGLEELIKIAGYNIWKNNNN